MPGQMRFCRLCGYRLGEGVAEYAETVRLQQPHAQGKARPVQTAGQRNDTASASEGADRMHGSFRDLNAMAQQTRQQSFSRSTTALGQSRRACGHSWPHWFIWPIIGITLSIAAAGGNWVRQLAHQAPVVTIETGIPQPPPPPNLPPLTEATGASALGANELVNAEGGATFESVTPGSAADQAGLVGGDIIKSFDGKPVKDADHLSELLDHTPVGKTVPVVFTRDGKTQTTTLKTISEEENDALEEQLDERSEGQGFIGEGTDLERVQVPGMNIEGVRLGEIDKNNPADIAGLRNGDIIIEFNDVPIRTREEFESRITRALPGSTIKAIIVRGGQRLEIPVKIGQDD
jgi:hypothetical protein